MLFVALALSLVAAQPLFSAPVRQLLPGGSIHSSLAAGESSVFTIDVPAQGAARVVVDQEGVDVTVTLRRQGTSDAARALDFVTGTTGRETIVAPVLDGLAVWTVAVSASVPGAARGDYTVTFELSTADDRTRAIAAARARHVEAWEMARATDGVALQRAEAGFAAAAAAAGAAGDMELAAESTFQRALVREVLGDLPGSVLAHRDALARFQALGRRDRQARVLTRIGDQLRKMGDMVDAQHAFDAALPLTEEVDDPVLLVELLNNSALLRSDIGFYEEALERYQTALPIARRLEAGVTELSLLCNIAESYMFLGSFAKSVDQYQQALVVAERLKIPRRTGRTLYLLAETYIESGDRVRAEQALRDALPLYEQSGDRVGFAVTQGLLARVLHANGDLAGAVGILDRALPLLRAGQAKGATATALRTLAEVDIDRKAFSTAQNRLTEALALDRAAGSLETEAVTLYLQALAFRGDDRGDDAIAASAASVTIVEGLRSAVQRSDLRTSYLAMVRRYYDLYIELLQQRGDVAKAFEVSERARARTLLEGLALSASKIQKGVDPQLLARERDVQLALNAKARGRATGADVDRLVDELSAIQTRIRSASPAYWSLQRPEPISAARVQSALVDEGTALVEYHLGERRSFVWVVDRASITSHELPGAAAIERAARAYHALLSRDAEALSAAAAATRTRQVAAAARRLAGLVWNPVASRVADKRLAIVADGALQYIPFAALPATNGTPLLALHEMVYLPSASVLDTIRRDNPFGAERRDTAVFADPVFSTNDVRLAAARDRSAPARTRASDGSVYGRLRFSRREAETIAAVAPGAFAALDFQAAKRTLLERDLRQYGILHIATHGTLNTEHPELSGLVFSLVDARGHSVDGFLRLHEIYNLDLNASLVVLSACSTALGKEIHGEGLIGLTRGFMFAGASRVVSSVWNVDDRASSLLMSRFYTEMLTKHLSPAAALRAAQLSMLREPRWSNPHYWAAFGLQGEWR